MCSVVRYTTSRHKAWGMNIFRGSLPIIGESYNVDVKKEIEILQLEKAASVFQLLNNNR